MSMMQTQSANRLGMVDEAVRAALRWLDDHQEPEGFWVGMIETNSAIEAEWLLASHILGVKLPMEDGIFRALLQRQRPDGSWETYPGAPAGDINSTVEVYVALRAKGFDPARPEMARAREWILRNGGLRNVRVFTRYWLALLGIWPWQATPNIPPEIIRLPLWFPFNIYNFAQWARATLLPLAVISSRRPVFPLACGRLDELFPDGYANFDFFIPGKKAVFLSLEWIFLKIDRILHAAQNARLTPRRETAIKLCLEWILKHQDADGAWGGIQPPWIYALVALRVEGYAIDHPVVAKGVSALSNHWSYERNGATHIQASESPVWDTLLSLLAMQEAGCPPQKSRSMQAALDWVLQKQVLWPGDWSVKVRNVASGGWAFERANLYYPDIDDTAVALLMLGKVRNGVDGALRQKIDAAIERALAWTLAMQSRNGGWGAFDKDNNKEIISKIPFCNFGEALDPPSVDVTGHVLEALAVLGLKKSDPAVAKALAFIRSEQEKDGSWFGRWGVNHIYGTAAVLPALQAIGEDMGQPYVTRAADWIASKQNPDGGWGESCASYMDSKLRGKGASTPSQTAWALMALLSVENPEHTAAIRKGVDFLVRTQDENGTWDERFYTGTGFPGYNVGARLDLDAADWSEKLQQGPELSRAFLLGYNMYRHYFPLLALGRAKDLLEKA
jgi:squalene-hopene/tetraprenyl-beta-curcumene cyclase